MKAEIVIREIRDTDNRDLENVIKKFKGNPDGMYTISPGPDSFDQKKFKNALQKEFGKTKGQVPLTQYIDKILNEEARLMGTATDGLITTRQIDPITLERMKPSYGLSGSRTLPPVGQITDDIALQELGLEKIILKQKRMIGYFVSNQQSDFYQTEAFSRMLKYVQQNSKSCVMKEKQTKNGLRLLITFIKIDAVKTALQVLQKI